MKIQFDDPLFEAWTQRFIFTMSEGGCEIGEIKATAARVPEDPVRDRDAAGLVLFWRAGSSTPCHRDQRVRRNRADDALRSRGGSPAPRLSRAHIRWARSGSRPY